MQKATALIPGYISSITKFLIISLKILFMILQKMIFPNLLSKGIKINTFPVKEYWSDIGTLNQYFESTQDLFENKYQINHSEIIKTPTGSYITEKSYIATRHKIYRLQHYR